MKRRLMVLGLVTTLVFAGFSVCNIDQVYGMDVPAKEDRKYTESEIDSTVKERANKLIATFDGKYFTSDGKLAGGSSSSDCNILKILNKSKRVRDLNRENKGGHVRQRNLICHTYILMMVR